MSAAVIEPEEAAVPATAANDLTGRDRMVSNVAASWAGHAVFIVAGFVMPRQIDRHIGQAGLGVWDFAWTAVNYFFLAQIGVGVSVNRYVARYRAAADTDGLCRMISSAVILQGCAACIVMLMTGASAWWLPSMFSYRLDGDVTTARWVIALLGTSVAVRMAVQGFSGVVTGCHRWDLHNLLNSGAYAVTVVTMIAALSFGGGLIGISVVYLAGTIVNEVARTVLAFHVCPELRVSVSRARYTEARALLAFGAKLSTIDVVKVVSSQLTNMLVLSQIGVETLAIYSRLGALIRHTENILSKFSLPLTPTASSLQGTGRDHEVRELLVGSTRFAAYLVWPILITFAVVGDDVLQVWMGPRYDPAMVLTLMAAASMFPISQQPIATILVGLNLHGRFGALNVVGAAAGFAASMVALGSFHWGLVGLAGVGLAVSNLASLWIAIDTCRRLSIPVREYFVRAYAGPLACMAPLAAALFAIGVAFDGRPVLTLAASAVLTVFVLAPVYWRFVLPADARATVTRRVAGWTAQLRLDTQPEA